MSRCSISTRSASCCQEYFNVHATSNDGLASPYCQLPQSYCGQGAVRRVAAAGRGKRLNGVCLTLGIKFRMGRQATSMEADVH